MDNQAIIFMASNRHGSDSGKPPHIIAEGKRYCGYFENAFGEQFLFAYDREAKSGTLWAGDAGWERAYPVVEGKVAELMLDEAELAWLRACWLAAGGVK